MVGSADFLPKTLNFWTPYSTPYSTCWLLTLHCIKILFEVLLLHKIAWRMILLPQNRYTSALGAGQRVLSYTYYTPWNNRGGKFKNNGRPNDRSSARSIVFRSLIPSVSCSAAKVSASNSRVWQISIHGICLGGRCKNKKWKKWNMFQFGRTPPPPPNKHLFLL